MTVSQICEQLLKLGEARNTCFHQVIVLIKLLKVMPVTSAPAERSFSALRRLKTYLRNSTGQERLNHEAIVHTHQTLADDLNLYTLAEEFIANRDNRRNFFGHFAKS
jgi:hypothetical protein